MWLPATQEVIYDMLDEKAMPQSFHLYNVLKRYINLNNWLTEYGELYHEWLHKDDNTIFDINAAINWRMIQAITEVNKVIAETPDKLFYWFDVDRNEKDWEWKLCPVSKTALIDLGSQFPSLNKLISIEHPLTFPE